MTVNAVYISPASAKAAGLSEEDHYVVVAQGSNADGEETVPPENKIILFDKNKKVVESRKLSDCPEEFGTNNDFSGEAG
jgi:hypothetical protein